MNDDEPDYLMLKAAFEAARKRWHHAYLANPTDKAADKAGLAEVEEHRERLIQHPDHAFVREVQKDEMASFQLVLAKQPRMVMSFCLEIKDDPDETAVDTSTASYPEQLFDAFADGSQMVILFDARRINCAQALDLLRNAIERVADEGMPISRCDPSPFDPSHDLFIDELTDGELRSISFRQGQTGLRA